MSSRKVLIFLTTTCHLD